MNARRIVDRSRSLCGTRAWSSSMTAGIATPRRCLPSPLATPLVGGFGLFFDDAEIRERGRGGDLRQRALVGARAVRQQLERTVGDALEHHGRLGPISVLLLIVAASGVMGPCATRSTRRGTSIRARRSSAASSWTCRSLGHADRVQPARSARRARRPTIWATKAGRSTCSGDAIVFMLGVALFLYRVLPSPRPRTRECRGGRRGRRGAHQPHARRAEDLLRVRATSGRCTARSAP